MSKMGLSFKTTELRLPCFSELDADFLTFELELAKGAMSTCFVCIAATPDYIAENWMRVMEEINYDYSAIETSNFERWNLYLIFCSEQRLDKDTQYVIENDKFAMRKLYIPLPATLSDSENTDMLIQLLNEKLLLPSSAIESQNDLNNNHEIVLAQASKSAIQANLSSSRSSEDKRKRQDWLNAELLKRMNDEN